ncbi:hypothetical protein VNO77_43444 [Canavalia gladiata]|uniref:Uncharacterized protein n=1 Tax=Canavalia gladiata TaxID=3824 RepID=A0AAN9PQ21_CANGL
MLNLSIFLLDMQKVRTFSGISVEDIFKSVFWPVKYPRSDRKEKNGKSKPKEFQELSESVAQSSETLELVVGRKEWLEME